MDGVKMNYAAMMSLKTEVANRGRDINDGIVNWKNNVLNGLQGNYEGNAAQEFDAACNQVTTEINNKIAEILQDIDKAIAGEQARNEETDAAAQRVSGSL